MSEEVAVSKHQHLLFLVQTWKNMNSCEIKRFLLVKLCFYLHFINDFLPLDPDPRTQMNPNPTGSGSTSVEKNISEDSYKQNKDFYFMNRQNYVKMEISREWKVSFNLTDLGAKLRGRGRNLVSPPPGCSNGSGSYQVSSTFLCWTGPRDIQQRGSDMIGKVKS